MAEKEANTTNSLRFHDLWTYDPAPESPDYVRIEKRYDLFINGRFQKPEGGNYFKTINPATEEVLSEAALATEKDVDKAVAAARNAYDKTWSKLPARERGKYIYRIARLLQERAREFAILESMDSGKPVRESRDVDIPLVIAHFFYYAGWADKLSYAFPGRHPRPLGVAGQIIPWNFPLLMAAWKIAPALAAGNTVVIKPASSTPLTLLRLGELIRDAGLPDGVVNIVTGPGKIGMALVKHPGVDKIAFTGSTEIGKLIQQAAMETDKKYTLELGGKAANIVFDDAAVDQAVEGIVNGIFFNQGHVCCAGSRLLVQEGVAEELVKKLKFRMESLIVGDPLDKNTDIGAINSRQQLNKILEFISDENGTGEEQDQGTDTAQKQDAYTAQKQDAYTAQKQDAYTAQKQDAYTAQKQDAYTAQKQGEAAGHNHLANSGSMQGRNTDNSRVHKSGFTVYQPACRLPEKGFWCPPTLVENVSQSHRIVQEEIFGPVLAIQTFRTPDEAVSLANNTPYGLSGGVWTDKGSKIFHTGKQIRAGVVWANTFNKFDPVSPFGGYKESGMGREGGLHGLLPYLELS